MRALLAAFVLIYAIGQSLAASDADQATIRDIIRSQIEAFQGDDGARAFSYATPSLRSLFGTQERFMDMVKNGYPPVYRPRSYTFGAFTDTPDGTSLAVHIQDWEGQSWVALYTLERQPDGTWRISGCSLVREPGQAA